MKKNELKTFSSFQCAFRMNFKAQQVYFNMYHQLLYFNVTIQTHFCDYSNFCDSILQCDYSNSSMWLFKLKLLVDSTSTFCLPATELWQIWRVLKFEVDQKILLRIDVAIFVEIFLWNTGKITICYEFLKFCDKCDLSISVFRSKWWSLKLISWDELVYRGT